MNDAQDQLNRLSVFVKNNLKQCCRELLEWHNTAILTDGKVREAANLLTNVVFKYNSLVITENTIKDEALQFVANQKI